MDNTQVKLIKYLYYLLLFITPVVLFPKTSELFEFNKMVLTYIFTVLIASAWVVRMILEKRLIFRRTFLDTPLLIFLISQTLSTLVSIDTRTSVLGYYSRFHGGLLSSYSYSILYWAFVSNVNRESTLKALKFFFSSALIVSFWAILERFGHSLSCLIFPDFKSFDVSCWVQDVQNRVFASIGQPNWLAAWITALIPLTSGFAIISRSKDDLVQRTTSFWHEPLAENIKNKYLKTLLWFSLSSIFFLTLLFTKSRSGILAYTISFSVFWFLSIAFFTINKKSTTVEKKLIIKLFAVNVILVFVISLIAGTPWTPKLNQILDGNSSQITNNQSKTTGAPALEVGGLVPRNIGEGGTESGKIRQIVWKGAIEIWKHYPILGTGVETFAFSYYNFRPAEHNLVSEWDYLYNKAHNEYLNFAATTGSVGLLAYLLLIGTTVFSFMKYQFSTSNFQTSSNLKISKLENSSKIEDWKLVNSALLSGYLSILITNFFGFSIVIVALQFFLYPAFAVTLAEQGSGDKEQSKKNYETLSVSQKILIAFIFCAMLFVLYRIAVYWYADYLYAQGKLNNDAGNFTKGRELINRAISLTPNEAIYWNELSESTTSLALIVAKENNDELARQLASSAIVESQNSVSLSPANVNIKKDLAANLIDLSPLNPDYISSALDTLIEAAKLAPTEPRLHYNLSIAYLRTGDYAKAIEVMKKAVVMKPDYRQARYSLALMYIDTGEKEAAKRELEYILNNLNPEDLEARRELEELEK